MQKRERVSPIYAQAEKVGLLVREGRPLLTEGDLQDAFSYLDAAGAGYVTIPQLTQFLTQAGVVATEQSVYWEIVHYRESLVSPGEYFEKPSQQKVQILYPEFKHMMTRTSLPEREAERARAAFADLMRITPSINGEKPGSLSATALFKQMLFWGVMTQEEIDMCRPFFCVGGRSVDVVYPERFIDRLTQ